MIFFTEFVNSVKELHKEFIACFTKFLCHTESSFCCFNFALMVITHTTCGLPIGRIHQKHNFFAAFQSRFKGFGKFSQAVIEEVKNKSFNSFGVSRFTSFEFVFFQSRKKEVAKFVVSSEALCTATAIPYNTIVVPIFHPDFFHIFGNHFVSHIDPEFRRDKEPCTTTSFVFYEKIIKCFELFSVIVIEDTEMVEIGFCLFSILHLYRGIVFCGEGLAVDYTVVCIFDSRHKDAHFVICGQTLVFSEDFKAEVFKSEFDSFLVDSNKANIVVCKFVDGFAHILKIIHLRIRNINVFIKDVIICDSFDQFRAFFSNLARCDSPINIFHADELVNEIDMEGKTFVHITDKNNVRLAFNGGIFKNTLNVSNNLGENFGTFNLVVQIVVELTFNEQAHLAVRHRHITIAFGNASNGCVVMVSQCSPIHRLYLTFRVGYRIGRVLNEVKSLGNILSNARCNHGKLL